jgi:hypothetical protein
MFGTSGSVRIAASELRSQACQKQAFRRTKSGTRVRGGVGNRTLTIIALTTCQTERVPSRMKDKTPSP